ncbi:hypothetical protein C3942_07360 [Solimonas fluminis]|uniref:Uncharacterized protein n=1 Tax=Solimonas fluminis TaxID=2086571 RepID=A0A2S5THY2_9GAMM|nr:hypothetical protein [Solimonas fluminis]PPE74571.1 hypothetical protein C3942_07360 [Solimonas fluminis]
MDPNQNPPARSEPGRKNTGTIILSVLALALALTWAVSTLFEIGLLKSFAAVILVLFGILVALFMSGIT